MTTDTLIIAAVICFFGTFGVTVFSVALWSNQTPKPAAKPRAVPARRPETGAETMLSPR